MDGHGFYYDRAGSQGVVQRFGRHVQTVPNGWGWRFRGPSSRSRKSTPRREVLVLQVARAHRRDEHGGVEVAVQYKVKQAEPIYSASGIRKDLSEVSESAIREVVGRNDLRAILESKRSRSLDTRDIMQRTLDQYGAGIEVTTEHHDCSASRAAQRDSEAQAIASG
jgi:membrane protease subunit HflK